jgi:hypothetical protein
MTGMPPFYHRPGALRRLQTGRVGTLSFFKISVVKKQFKISSFWAHRRSAAAGLSACIFFAYGKKGYRSYPLRESKPLRGFDFSTPALHLKIPRAKNRVRGNNTAILSFIDQDP